jgi:hypothetical protein
LLVPKCIKERTKPLIGIRMGRVSWNNSNSAQKRKY